MRSSYLFSLLFMLLIRGALEAADAPRLLPFQARLLDATGKPLPDGTAVIQFQLFPQPTGGTPIWAGELHRVTIQGGLVNVVLGSKNPLPLTYPGDESRPVFGSTLYLQATPAAPGSDKITAADPPLLPRQTILPVLFAAESAVSRNSLNSLNSAKLAGWDWSALLDSTDAATGKLNGSRILNGTIGTNQLAPNAVTGSKIADQAVSITNLVRRQTAASATKGGIAVSPVLSNRTINSPDPSSILSVQLRTTGRPVLVSLVGSDSEEAGVRLFKAASDGGTVVYFRLERAGIPLVTWRQLISSPNFEGSIGLPVSWTYLDTSAPDGDSQYTIKCFVNGTSASAILSGLRLFAYEP